MCAENLRRAQSWSGTVPFTPLLRKKAQVITVLRPFILRAGIVQFKPTAIQASHCFGYKWSSGVFSPSWFEPLRSLPITLIRKVRIVDGYKTTDISTTTTLMPKIALFPARLLGIWPPILGRIAVLSIHWVLLWPDNGDQNGGEGQRVYRWRNHCHHKIK